MPQNCKTLDELWEFVYKLNKEHFPENKLMPILGGGKIQKPKAMFVFINPTSRNISSDPSWKGQRFPFTGTKQIWNVFHKAGLFDDQLAYRIRYDAHWSVEFANKVIDYIKGKSFYFTNIVKWTGHNADLPDSKKTELFLPVLKREIELVQPEYVVTFGLIPFEKLTGEKIRLSDYYSEAVKNKKLKSYEIEVNSVKTKVIPCYFPVGRGSPKKAVEILKLAGRL